MIVVFIGWAEKWAWEHLSTVLNTASFPKKGFLPGFKNCFSHLLPTNIWPLEVSGLAHLGIFA